MSDSRERVDACSSTISVTRVTSACVASIVPEVGSGAPMPSGTTCSRTLLLPRNDPAQGK